MPYRVGGKVRGTARICRRFIESPFSIAQLLRYGVTSVAARGFSLLRGTQMGLVSLRSFLTIGALVA